MPRRAPLVPLRMALTGTASTVVDVATLLVLVTISPLPAGVAAAAGCLVGGATNFALLRRWVFRLRGPGLARQLALYVLTVVLAGAVLCGSLVQLAVHLGLAVIAAKLLAGLVTLVAWNYPVSAHVVFRPEAP